MRKKWLMFSLSTVTWSTTVSLCLRLVESGVIDVVAGLGEARKGLWSFYWAKAKTIEWVSEQWVASEHLRAYSVRKKKSASNPNFSSFLPFLSFCIEHWVLFYCPSHSRKMPGKRFPFHSKAGWKRGLFSHLLNRPTEIEKPVWKMGLHIDVTSFQHDIVYQLIILHYKCASWIMAYA